MNLPSRIFGGLVMLLVGGLLIVLGTSLVVVIGAIIVMALIWGVCASVWASFTGKPVRRAQPVTHSRLIRSADRPEAQVAFVEGSVRAYDRHGRLLVNAQFASDGRRAIIVDGVTGQVLTEGFDSATQARLDEMNRRIRARRGVVDGEALTARFVGAPGTPTHRARFVDESRFPETGIRVIRR